MRLPLFTIVALIAAVSLLAGGCNEPAARRAQAVSLLGETLYPTALTPEDERMCRERLAEARLAYEADPWNEVTIIWLGRRQAYLGWYDRAIETFSEGLRLHPGSYRLLRHRGHRYLTTRRLDLASSDLERAAALAEGVPDEVEPDGQPNAQNIPRGTNKTAIYYHLGLARYLNGEYERAASAYARCLGFSKNDDMMVATLYWMYLSLMRLDRVEEAAEHLDLVAGDMDVIENFTYHRLLLLFKGDLPAEEVMDPARENQIQSSTAAYGVAWWHRFRGEDDAADAMLARLVADPAWPAFGHLAAEADLARQRTASLTSP